MLPQHRQVLEALADLTKPDGEMCVGFGPIAIEVGFDIPRVRRIVRHLARLGRAEFHKGLWDEDWEPAGAGYCITKEGLRLISVDCSNG
jgi:hypothetical protein